MKDIYNYYCYIICIMISIRKFNINDYDGLIKLWVSAKLPFKPKGRDKYENLKNEIKKIQQFF